MFFIYKGEFSTGKTKIAIEKINDILRKERLNSGELLMFISKVNEINRIKEEITAEVYGELNICSSPSFIIKEIIRFWPIIIEEENLKAKDIVPKIINRDISRYILEKIIHRKRIDGFFNNITSTNRELASNILMSMNIGALNKFQLEDIPKRLLTAFDNVNGNIEKIHYEMKQVIAEFKDILLSKGKLDTSMAIELYNRILLNNSFYIDNARSRFHYLIVDDGEYLPPVIVDFIVKIKEEIQEGYIFYNEDYIDFSYLGGDLTYFKDNLCKEADILTIDNNHDKKKQKLINIIEERYDIGVYNFDFDDFIKIDLQYSLRLDMIEGIIEEITKLLTCGYKEGDIAIIAPYRDNILIHKLKKSLSLNNEILVLGDKKKVFEDSTLHGLLTIALLAQKLKYSKDITEDITSMLSTILDIDLLKAYGIANNIKGEKDTEIYLEGDKKEKLMLLKDFIKEYENQDISINEFLRRAYLQLFISEKVNYDTLSSCKELFNIIEECEATFKEFWRDDKICEVITNFLLNEAKGKVQHFREDVNELMERSLIFTTLSSYLNSNLIKKILIVADISSEGYIPKVSKNLFNSDILRISYNKNDVVNDRYPLNLLKALICRANEKIIFVGSTFSERGYEQENRISIILQDISG